MWPEIFFIAGIYFLFSVAVAGGSLFSCGTWIAPIVVLLYYTIKLPRAQWFGRLWIWKWFRDFYFPLTYEGHIQPPPSGHVYVYAMAPHGLFAWASIFGVLLNSDLFGHVECSTSSVIFAFPIIRSLAQMLGAFPASSKEFKERIERGQSVLINPEGVKAHIHMNRRREGMLEILKARKGFCSMLASCSNARSVYIVPVFTPGEWDTYWTWFPWPRFQEWMISRFRYSGPFVMLGWLGTCLPKRVPLHMTFGEPIPVCQEDCDYQDGGEQLHAAYMDAIYFMSEGKSQQFEVGDN